MNDSSDSHAEPGQAITIMADYGNGPYAWLKDASDERSYVGTNIADAVAGFCGDPPVSRALENDFAEWAISFERGADSPAFDWPGFHSCGIALSHRLFREIGRSFRIFYVKPHEDPKHDENGRIEILGDQIVSG
jgi:hypothetical protein